MFIQKTESNSYYIYYNYYLLTESYEKFHEPNLQCAGEKTMAVNFEHTSF